MTIEELRSRISEIDNQLLTLLTERMEISCLVGEYKAEHNVPVLDEGREVAIIRGVEEKSERFSEQNTAVYKEIMHQSRGLQQKIKKN